MGNTTTLTGDEEHESSVQRNIDKQPHPKNRILMLGLDAAGKTTILYSLREHFKASNIDTVIPTVGWNIEILQLTFNKWRKL